MCKLKTSRITNGVICPTEKKELMAKRVVQINGHAISVTDCRTINVGRKRTKFIMLPLLREVYEEKTAIVAG